MASGRFLVAGAAVFVGLSSLMVTPARAQSQGLVSLPPVGPGESRLLVGAALLERPVYPGAQDRQARLLPYVDYARRDGFFAGVPQGIGYVFLPTPTTQAGLRLIPQFGRDASDSTALRGMGDIAPGIEASAFVTHALSREWTVGAQMRGGEHGFEADAGARRDFMIGPTTRLSVTGYGTLADARSQQTFFGVDAAQAVRSGYAPYRPGAGLRSVQLAVSANHFIGQRWLVVGGVGVGRLLGGAADAPFVRERSPYGGFAAVGYRWW